MPNTGDIVRASDFEAIKPQLSIGTVTTGAAGSNASASITGTSPNFKLNLTIPRGNTGATGPQGPSGTYTGPLKPTNSYWRGATFTLTSGRLTLGTGRFNVPSGGTWAVCAISPMGGTRVIQTLAGGTLLYNHTTNTNFSMAESVLSKGWLCWRIQ